MLSVIPSLLVNTTAIAFGSTWHVSCRSSLSELALSVCLCVVVDLGIDISVIEYYLVGHNCQVVALLGFRVFYLALVGVPY